MPDPRTPDHEHEPETETEQPEEAAAAEADGAEAAEPQDPAAARIAELETERDESRDRLLRTAAEMDNLRKRTRREVQDAHAHATADVVRDMLEVLDDVERAVAAAGDDDAEDGPAAAIRQGVTMIESRLRDALTRRGVQRLEVGAGDEFDPREHEAVAQIPGGDVTSGAVVEVVLAGYRLGDRVLRPARVVVAQ